MKKLIALLMIVGMAGILLTSITVPAIADGQGKGNDDGKGNPDQGLAACENSNGKAQSSNPHCTADDDGDGVPNWQDACPTEAGTGDDGCPPASTADLSVRIFVANAGLGLDAFTNLGVSNNGPDTAEGIVATVTLSEGLSWASAPECAIDGLTITCDFDSIAPGSAKRIISSTVNCDSLTQGIAVATVTSSSSDPISGNNVSIDAVDCQEE